MLEPIRLATPEEIEKIKDVSHLTPTSTVLSFAGNMAVLRPALELDPVIFSPESDTRRRAVFIWGIENALRVMGTPAYYFNVSTEDKPWQEAVEKWGAQRLSETPEYRYYKAL